MCEAAFVDILHVIRLPEPSLYFKDWFIKYQYLFKSKEINYHRHRHPGIFKGC
jgi:hypothetical protein